MSTIVVVIADSRLYVPVLSLYVARVGGREKALKHAPNPKKGVSLPREGAFVEIEHLHAALRERTCNDPSSFASLVWQLRRSV